MLGRSRAGRSDRRSHWHLGRLPGPQSGRYGRAILRDTRALVVHPCLALFWRSMLLQFPKHVVMIVVGCQLHMQLEARRFEEPHQRRQRRLAPVMLVADTMVLATPARLPSSDWLRPAFSRAYRNSPAPGDGISS